MKSFALLAAGFFAVAALGQDTGKMPSPSKEHGWLKHLDGEWTSVTEAVMEPGKPPIVCKGTESVRSLGGFWSLAESKGDMMGVPMTGVMQVGYDPAKKKFVGSFVCSVCDTLFTYEGTLDDAGKVLTLNTEGPHMVTGKTVKMKDVIEIVDKDHKVMKSFMMDDGKWVQFMTAKYERKK